MNEISKSAFNLNLEELKAERLTKDNLTGLLLAACSAHNADQKKQIQIIKYLVKVGANPNETDKNGVTPLHRAVRFRSPAAVSAILKLGANVNAQDKKSLSTPLHRAVTSTGAPKTKGKGAEVYLIIEMLFEHGADPMIRNKLGKMPLEYVKDESIKNLFQGKQTADHAASKGAI